jgi:hypothetical protein
MLLHYRAGWRNENGVMSAATAHIISAFSPVAGHGAF